MIKIFNHYLHRRTIQQIFLDFGLILAAVLVELLLREADFASSVALLGYTAMLASGMLVINTSMGFYQRVHNRSVNQSRARAVLAIVLAVPLAYAVFSLM